MSMNIEINIPKVTEILDNPEMFRNHIKDLMKKTLKMKYDSERNGVEADMSETLDEIQKLTTILLFACENMFMLSFIIGTLDDVGMELNAKYGEEKTNEIIMILNSKMLNDIFDRLEQNNVILENINQ